MLPLIFEFSFSSFGIFRIWLLIVARAHSRQRYPHWVAPLSAGTFFIGSRTRASLCQKHAKNRALEVCFVKGWKKTD
jgi:hypothetical protein